MRPSRGMQQGGFAYLSSLGSTVGLRGAGARPMRQIFDEFEKARCVSSFEQVTTVLAPLSALRVC